MTSRAFPILAVVLLVASGCSAAHVVSQWAIEQYVKTVVKALERDRVLVTT